MRLKQAPRCCCAWSSPIAGTVAEFVAMTDKVGAALEIIDVPHGRRGFDYLDHPDESRAAVERPLDTVLAHLAP